MKPVVIRHALCCIFLYFFSINIYAWNLLGHMVVAEIAYQALKPIAREKIDFLVAQFNEQYPSFKSFSEMAYWPDTLKGQKIQLFTRWHYVDYPISFDNTLPKRDIDTDNAVWAINQLQNIMKNNSLNSHDKSRFLAFFVHVISDLHQPLHTVSLYSQKHLEGDKGGNLYQVYEGNESTNLHRVWDKGVSLFSKPYSRQHASEIATLLLRKYPPEFFGTKIYVLKTNEWTNEGKEQARKYVYDTAENEPLSAEYEKRAKASVEQTAALAGYRLAIFLNQLFV